MARFNTALTSSSISGTATISTLYSGAFTEFTGTAPYTVTLPSPVLYPGYNQTFYNATSGTITLTTPANVFTGAGGSGTANVTVPTTSTINIVSDGVNYVVVGEDGTSLTATTGAFSGNVTINGASATLSVTPQTVTINPGGTSTIDNVNIGETTRGSGAFNTLAANNAVTFTANTASSTTGTGTLVVTGGIGASGNINSGGTVAAVALSGPLTGTVQTAAQANITSLGTLTSLTVTGVLAVDTNTIYVDSTNHRLGVGTSSPSYTLDVRATTGSIAATSNTGTNFAKLQCSNSGGSYQFGIDNSAGSNFGSGTAYSRVIWNDSSTAPTILYTSSTERMRIDSSGNLGVGTSSPVYKLDVQSSDPSIRIKNTNAPATGGNSTLLFEVGNNYSGTSQSFIKSIGAGNSGTTNLTFGTSGVYDATATERMRLDSSGNLGVGVTPSAWNSTSKAFQLPYGSFWSFTDGIAAGNNYYYNSAGNRIYLANAAASEYYQTAGQHIWRTAPSGTAGNPITFTQVMTLNASGELNIDSGTSGGRLTFTPGNTANSILSTTTGFGAYNILRYRGAQHQWLDSAGTQAMTLDASGNLSLGPTSSPYTASGRKVFAIDATTSTMLALQTNSTNRGYVYADNSTFAIEVENPLQLVLNTIGANPISFKTSNTERARIDSSGNLLVGTTTVTGARITSQNGSNTSCLVAINAFGSCTVPVISSSSYTTPSTAWYSFIGQSGNGSAVTANNILIFGNGNIVNTNNSYGAYSDIKLKENITDATPKLAHLNQVRVVNYNLKGEYEKHKQLGVVAQELEQIFPSMVDETPDRDMEGNDLGTTTKSVKYSVFVPMLIKAIQEQQATIESLKARLDAANL